MSRLNSKGDWVTSISLIVLSHFRLFLFSNLLTYLTYLDVALCRGNVKSTLKEYCNSAASSQASKSIQGQAPSP
jgi:hypothetical protein